jgi:hypothetical protein
LTLGLGLVWITCERKLVRDPFKPLFNARLLSEALEAAHIQCGLAQTEIAQRWADSAGSGALGSVKEKQLQGQFLTEIFGGLLGYAQIVSADEIDLMWKTAPPRMPISH